MAAAQAISDTGVIVRPGTRAVPTQTDRTWLVGAALVLVALCGLPYLVSALFGPRDL